jgi:hypothetical protein
VAALSGALAARAAWPAMGSSGRRIVEDEFAWPVLARMHVDMYRQLLEPNP